MAAVPFSTDLAVLAVFDPKVLQHRMRQPKTWWRETAILDVPELLEGKLALFPIGAEGSFALRVTLEALTPDEQKLSVGAVGVLGVSVTGEEVFAGAAERLPGEGIGDRVVEIPGTGKFSKVAPGDYDVTVHVLDWRTKREFFDEDGEPLPSAPADFVIALAPRTKPFDAPNTLGSLLDLVPRPEVKPERLKVPPSPPRRAPAPAPRPGSGARPSAPPPEPEAPAPPAFGPFDPALIRRAFRDVVQAHRSWAEPSPRFASGSLILKPRDSTLQIKEIPVEDLLGKVTRLREQMRVLEQKVNAHEGLEDEQKLSLDARITSVYEALCGLAGLLSE